jgi:hypothetical protein
MDRLGRLTLARQRAVELGHAQRQDMESGIEGSLLKRKAQGRDRRRHDQRRGQM